jgi:hypothetical protein
VPFVDEAARAVDAIAHVSLERAVDDRRQAGRDPRCDFAQRARRLRQ